MDRRAQAPKRTRSYGNLSIAALPLALGLCACLDNKLAPNDAADGGTVPKRVFLAAQRDFADFRDWMTYAKDVPDDHGGIAGTTTVYLNEMPPEGADKFPVATMLVKTMAPADGSRLTIHAMVKRGGTFNPKGTIGWEFFELALNKSDVPIILWRGDEPPDGEMYQQLLSKADIAPDMMGEEQSCNDCHASARDGTFDDIADLLTAP